MRLATSMSSSPMNVYTRKSTRQLYGMVHDRHTHSVVSTLVERCVHAWRASSAHMIGGGFAKLPTANTSQQLPCRQVSARWPDGWSEWSEGDNRLEGQIWAKSAEK